MINQAFAEQFIRRIRSQTDYNINIMNEHGIIIASCSEERVGTFHATAFRMITNNISINVTEDLTEDLPRRDFAWGEPAAAGEPDPGGRHRRLRRSIHRNVPGQAHQAVV